MGGPRSATASGSHGVKVIASTYQRRGLLLGGLAEFERELIRARTGEGRKRAQARGVARLLLFPVRAHVDMPAGGCLGLDATFTLGYHDPNSQPQKAPNNATVRTWCSPLR